MIAGFLVFSLAALLTPLAQGPLVVAGAFLVGQQLFGDGAITIFEVNAVTLRQRLVADSHMGRVNSSLRFLSTGALFVGSFLGAFLGEEAGLRPTFVAGAAFGLAGTIWLALSPLRST